jgi:26S proteasome regulatory subunit N3
LLLRSKDLKEGFTEKFDLNKTVVSKVSKCLELEAFLKIFVIQILWREARYSDCLSLVSNLIEVISNANRRSLDNFNAVLLGYYSRIHEKMGDEITIREFLLDAYNKACVRVDEISQSTLLNLLLRNYLKHNHIDTAFNLI